MTGKFDIVAVLDVCGVPWRRGLRLRAPGAGPQTNVKPAPNMAVGHTMWRGAARGGISNQI